MSDFVILSLILFLLVCLVLTVVGLVVYTGLLSEVVVRTGSPPIKKITIAYKLHKGSYKDSGAAFTESCSIAPKLSCIALYYDDPNQTQADSCRYAVGSVLSENEETPDEELQRLYEKFGFHIISFPEVSCAVMSSFPNRCSISPVCGAYRVFPELNAYIAERRLTAYPYMEICKGDVIHYMCPLEKQESFFVPELLEKQIADEKDTKDDKDTDVKETDDSCKSESSAAVVKAEAESCDIETSPVVQQQSEEDGQTEEGDQGSKGSSESVGSGSSFEELDMDLEEAEKQREADEECRVDDKEKRTDNDG